MLLSLTAALVGDQEFSEPKVYEWRFDGFPRRPTACEIGPNQKDDHVFGGGMDWRSKTLGAENF